MVSILGLLGHLERGNDHLAHTLDFAAQAVVSLAVDAAERIDEPELQIASSDVGLILALIPDRIDLSRGADKVAAPGRLARHIQRPFLHA